VRLCLCAVWQGGRELRGGEGGRERAESLAWAAAIVGVVRSRLVCGELVRKRGEAKGVELGEDTFKMSKLLSLPPLPPPTHSISLTHT